MELVQVYTCMLFYLVHVLWELEQTGQSTQTLADNLIQVETLITDQHK